MQNLRVVREARAPRSHAAAGRNTRRVQVLLLIESASFVLASLVHRGVFVGGYEHAQAAAAETMIGAVLLVGLAITPLRPRWTRAVSLSTQGFALLGTLVGVATIAIGARPYTRPDVGYHVAILTLLVVGLALTARSGGEN